MAYNFPSSPTLNQLYTYQGYTWSWNGQYWRIQAPQAVTGATGATGIGATGATGPAGAPGTPGTPGSGGGGAANVTVRDEGTVLTTAVSSINFVGAGVSSSASGDAVTVTISGGGGGGGSTLTFGNTVPANPQVGDRWINSEDLIELVYVNDGDNSFWLEPAGGSGGGGGGGGNFTYGNTAPVAPAIGDRWMDSDNLKEFVYIYDGDSYAWVEPSIDAGLVGATGATGPQGATGAGATGATGPTGLGFTIAKSYASVALLLADTAPTGIVAGQFGIVETGNVENAENSRLYLWSGTAWSYVTDLSGAQGITGPQGATGIQGNVGPVGATGPAGTSANISVYDEGSLVTGTVTGLNFVGAGITANTVSGNVQITVTATGTGSGGGFQYTNTAPASPQTGDRWLDSDSMIEYVYVNDGDSSQWVEPITRAFSTNLTSVSTHVIPDSNVSYDLGTSSLRWRDLYLSGNSIILGAATLSSTGSAVNLPAGSTVGGQNIPSSGDVATGGGPKITNVQVTNSSWTVLDDTAVDTAGGYVKITGTNFVSGCQVVAGTTTASAVSFVSSTELRVQFGAIAAGTYILYVSNPDGGVALRVNGITFSASPSWQTGSSLGEIYDGVVINLGLVATEATSYVVTAGSLPPGLTLNANTGVITGTVTGVTVETTYNFTVTATDPQNQDSPRAFSVTVTISDAYFKLTSLLLSGSAISANTVIRDSSTNNFNLTVYGDSRASNFTPYGTGWSVYFDGTGDLLSGTITGGVGSGDFTLEYWVYHNTLTDWQTHFATTRGVTGFNVGTDASGDFVFYDNVGGTGGRRIEVIGAITVNRWYHFAFSRSGTSLRGFLDGTLRGTYTTSQDYSATAFYIGALDTTQEYTNGYISNLRLVRGTALYTANFTPATTNLTSVANTSLLTCHANRFLDGSTNNFTITRNGDAAIRSFNPFNITNTGVNGSAYFDGTGDYCAVAANSAFSFPADFTWEAWAYPFGMPNGGYAIIYATGGSGSQDQFGLSPTEIFGAGTAIPAPIRINTWMHCVICRQGSTVRYFVNGILAGTFTNSATIGSNANNALIGMRSDSSHAFQGYIADLRITKGTALYTANFTPPTQPLTAVANTQLLTLQYDQPHNNHTFLDSSSNQFVITRNGNTTQGTFSPFSQTGWGNYFAGATNNSITVATGSGYAFGTGDFCKEFFCYANSYPANWRIISAQTSSVVNILQSSGAILGVDIAGGGITTTGFTLPTTTWFHLVVTRQSNTIRVFIDGVLRYNVSNSTNFSTSQSVYIGGFPGFTQSWDGYISNARIIKGSVPANYQTSSTTNGTTIFTPPTSPLTAVTGTELLTCQSNRFSDSNTQVTAKTITVTGSPSVAAFSPFSPTAVYSPVSHGGSAYFDGTGDSLSLPANWNGVTFGTGAFSFEVWVYPLATNTDSRILGASNFASDARLFFSMYGSTGFGIATGSAWQLFTSTPPPLYQWTHIVVCRSGGTLSIFFNGVRQATSTNNNSLGLDTSYSIGGGNWYLSNLRIVKNSTAYDPTQTTLTVPTAPSTATIDTQLLLNFTDAAILDSTGRNVLETVADAKSSSVITKFTGGSMSFDGTGDRLATVFSPLQDLSLGNWTIEFWLNLGATIPTTYRSICGASNGGGGTPKWVIIMNANTGYSYQANRIMFATYNGADRQINAAVTWESNTWYHIAVVHNNGTTALYLNGSSQGTIAFNIASGITGAIRIGADGEGYSDFTGYISDFRITRGHARYTANFTPPTAPARLK